MPDTHRADADASEGDTRSRAGLAVLLAVAIALLAPAPAAARPWEKFDVPIQAKQIFDLGVADYNGDGDLDLFTANHKYRGTLLRNEGGARFSDVYYASRHAIAAEIPGLNSFFREPRIGPRGLYIWIDEDNRTQLRTVGLGESAAQPQETVSGLIRFYGRGAEILRRRGAAIAVRRDESTTPPGAVLRFSMDANARLSLRSRFADLPFDVAIDPSFPRSRILAGPFRAHPPTNAFRAHFSDRHGVSWADLDGDLDIDSYITAGGLRGAIGRFQDFVDDELLISDGGRFEERSAELGVAKGACRGRQSAIVDFDGDGRLDLFSGCERSHPIIWRQQAGGSFGSRTQQLAAVGADATKYRWIDLLGDEGLELLAVRRREASIYGEWAGGWREVYSLPTLNRDKRVDAIAPGDFDTDGDLDIFIASPSGNTLLQTRAGRLTSRRPAALGLPESSLSANWVDLDNDARPELHALPQGIYARADEGEAFTATGELSGREEAKWATASFADLDGDGFRDVVRAEKLRGVDRVRVSARENPRSFGDWLELDLVGPPGNRQAIGARALLRAPGGNQLQLVGGAESSRWGQGHYRLYFGLGEGGVRDIFVHWPDGRRTKIVEPELNRRLQVFHPGA